MSAISGWHSSSFHDEIELTAGVLEGVHSHDDTDADSPIHIAAHCLGHGVALPDQGTPHSCAAPAETIWPVQRIAALDGDTVSSLLRPPQG